MSVPTSNHIFVHIYYFCLQPNITNSFYIKNCVKYNKYIPGSDMSYDCNVPTLHSN